MEEKRPVGRPRKYKSGMHPNTIAARQKTQWVKGQKPNPLGRPQVNPTKPTADSIIAKVGNEKVRVSVDGTQVTMTKFEKLIRTLFADSFKSKPTAQKELIERIWGKTADNVNLNLTKRKEFDGKNPKDYVQSVLDGTQAEA